MNLLDLFVRIGAKDEASGVLGNIGSTALKVGDLVAKGIGAAAGGISYLAKQAVSAYGDFEQLSGGVETLFATEDAISAVMANAANAWQTTGLSANEYMEMVTSSAAAMVASLDGDYTRAAEMSDMAARDMSDNANKMGTAMESIQNAYNGFAKGNFTMLDNLKLGYGGTKEEMQRLLDKAQEISGIEYDISSYADIVEAIHIVQDNLGITGTTAKEAGSTIQGSMSAMKAAWNNLIAGFANPDADIGELMSTMVQAGSTALGNLIPAISNALVGIGEAVQEIAPLLTENLPAVVEQVLPPLISAATTLVQGLAAALPDVISVLAESAPLIFTTIIDAVTQLIPTIAPLALQIIMALANALITEAPKILDAGLKLVQAIGDGLIENIPALIMALTECIVELAMMLSDPANLSSLIESALGIIMAIVQGLLEALPVLVEAAPIIVQNIVNTIIDNLPLIFDTGIQMITSIFNALIDNLPMMLDAAVDIVFAIADGIVQYLGLLIEKGADIINSIKEGFDLDAALQWGKDLIQNFIDGIKAKWQALKDSISNIAQTVKDYIGFSEPDKGPLSNFHTYAPDMMDLFAQGIRDNEDRITRQIEKSFDFPMLRNIDVEPNVSYNGGTGGDSEFQIVLDDGTLVGKLTNKIDRALGVNYAMTKRGALV